MRSRPLAADDQDLYRNPSIYKDLQDVICTGKCLLFVGPGLSIQTGTEEDRPLPHHLPLLKGIVDWCSREGIIDQQNTIEFYDLIHKQQLTQVGYKIEEYLVEKQRCIEEVLQELAQQEEIYQTLAKLPFRGYITTTYDTFLEAAYLGVKQSELSKFYRPLLQSAVEACLNNQPFIAKLHGDIDNPAFINIGHHLAKGLSSPDCQNQLRQLLLGFPALFIGFEKNDPDLKVFQNIIEDADVARTQNTYWIIVSDEQRNEPEGKDLWSYKRINTISLKPHELYSQFMASFETVVWPDTIPGRTFQPNMFSAYLQQPLPGSAASTEGGKRPLLVFTAYHPKDQGQQEEIEVVLNTLLRQEKGLACFNLPIPTGAGRHYGHVDYISKADLILLLVSRYFVATDYCYTQVPQATQRQDACTFAIILTTCSWKNTPLVCCNVLPDDENPIDLWPNSNMVYTHIEDRLRLVIRELKNRLPN